MKVAPTGIIFYGICSVKSPKCTAKETVGPITAVWTPPGHSQVNVCRSCLNFQLRENIWKIDGAMVKGLNKVIDFGVLDTAGNLVIIFEIKNKSNIEDGWSKNIFEKEIAPYIPDQAKYFVLVSPTKTFCYDIITRNMTSFTSDYLLEYLQRSKFSMAEISVTDSNEFRFNYKNVVTKHYNLQKIVREYLEDVRNRKTTLPNELNFLEPLLVESIIKEEYVIE